MNHIDLVLFAALVMFGWFLLACRPWGIGHDQAEAASLERQAARLCSCHQRAHWWPSTPCIGFEPLSASAFDGGAAVPQACVVLEKKAAEGAKVIRTLLDQSAASQTPL